ncbi:MAG TPA: hypothetical protein DCO77_03020 [Nitrospiraceae bacterium]|nr:hypothetical protein [Nitrospiraceae bacterium]
MDIKKDVCRGRDDAVIVSSRALRPFLLLSSGGIRDTDDSILLLTYGGMNVKERGTRGALERPDETDIPRKHDCHG